MHGSEGSSRQGREETCVCLKRTQRNKLTRSTQTTCLSLVSGSDTTTHHIFRICPAPLAMHGCLRSLHCLPKTHAKNKCKNSASKRTALQHALFFEHKKNLINSKNDIMICQCPQPLRPQKNLPVLHHLPLVASHIWPGRLG